MDFEIVSGIEQVEVIAVGGRVRERRRLRRTHGLGTWRKMKGIALVQLEDGMVYQAEIHWYEASETGRREYKIKRVLD